MIVYLFLNLLACSPDKSNDGSVSKAPQCLVNTEQPSLWNRLGTPASISETNQVAPSLVVFDDTLWLYYSQRDGLSDTVTLIRSEDGLAWSTPEVIDSLSDFSDIMHMHVSVSDDGLITHIGGGRIGTAYSTDGIQWNASEIQIVPSGEFDTLGQLYPTLNDDITRMWYTGFNGQSYSIGTAARTNDGWEHQGMVLEANSTSPHENRAVAQMTVMNTDEGYRAWYGGYDTSQTDPGPWRILSAVSNDGFQWRERQLSLDIEDLGEEAWSVREPSVALWNGTLWMAYVGMGDDGEYRLKMATCD